MKKALIVGILTLGLTSSSCLGPDRLYSGLKQWNADVSDKDWLNELVFLGLMVIPVYPIALFVDTWIMNPIRYWGGNTANDPGAFTGFVSGD